ncbi:MAG: CBASS oligonucleotide cyclase [Planctomycetota bacterium]|jgi:hypothetical protein
MGGSGGLQGEGRGSGEARDLLRQAERDCAHKSFDAELSAELAELLKSYNERNTDLRRQRLDEILSQLEGEIEGHLDTLYGGSVAKHTSVDGLSDVDTMLLVDKSALAGKSPEAVLKFVEDRLRSKLEGAVNVSAGDMAVTVRYGDGMEIQLLPSLRTPDGLKVSNPRGRGWAEIAPAKFREALTKRNQQCGSMLVPAIKLVKAINAGLPDAQQLGGYHQESLAISAFRGYAGARAYPEMLRHFFARAADLVKSPMADSTGQSVHVDGDLGPADSGQRQEAAHVLRRIARRMDRSKSIGQWLSLFGI